MSDGGAFRDSRESFEQRVSELEEEARVLRKAVEHRPTSVSLLWIAILVWSVVCAIALPFAAMFAGVAAGKSPDPDLCCVRGQLLRCELAGSPQSETRGAR